MLPAPTRILAQRRMGQDATHRPKVNVKEGKYICMAQFARPAGVSYHVLALEYLLGS